MSYTLKFFNHISYLNTLFLPRGSLLTGKYPVQLGIYPGVFVPDDLGGLSLEHETIARKLYQKGYSTAHVGKWHLGVGMNREYLPTEHGFEK